MLDIDPGYCGSSGPRTLQCSFRGRVAARGAKLEALKALRAHQRCIHGPLALGG